MVNHTTDEWILGTMEEEKNKPEIIQACLVLIFVPIYEAELGSIQNILAKKLQDIISNGENHQSQKDDHAHFLCILQEFI